MDALSLSLVHRVAAPRVAPAPGVRPPLLVLLHGVGSNEDDLFGLAHYFDARFLIVSARAPLANPPGYGWYPIVFTPDGIEADESYAPSSRDKIVAFVREALAGYGADPGQVFLLGFSQGAAMSLYTALTHPEEIAGVAALSGRLLPQVPEEAAAAARLLGKPFLVQHGTLDPVLPLANGRAIRDFLEKRPVDLDYREYTMAHELTQQSLVELVGWLRDRLG